MPFDGLNHRPSLVSPYMYHPHAPATPDGLATVLRAAYSYARNSGRMIGWQTYNVHLARPRSFVSGTYISATTWVNVARFRRTISPSANYAWFEAQFRISSGRSVDVFHRIQCTDGVDTATGVTVETTYDADQSVIDPNFNAVNARDVVYVAGLTVETTTTRLLARQAVRGRVLLTGANLDDGQRTYTVQAYAVGADGVAAENYWPELITAWSETDG